MSKSAKVSAEPEKAVVITERTPPVLVEAPSTPALVPSDIIIPKLLLMQGLSEFVSQRKAQQGDIVRSTNVEKIGSPEKSIDFIPLSFPESQWVIEVNTTGKFQFKRAMSRTASNSGIRWTFWADKDGNVVSEDQDQDGRAIPQPAGSYPGKRVQRMSFYALLPQDIEADVAEKKKAESGEFPDFSKALTPVLIGCRSMSFQAGKEVLTFFTQAASFKRQAWEAILTLKCGFTQNEKGSFYLFEVDRSRPRMVAKEHLETVKYWASIVATQALKVDESVAEDEGSRSGATHF